MKTIDTQLIHRVLLPENPQGKVHPTLIMLHGRGADEEDLIGLAPYFDRSLMVISVRAPYDFPSGGYTWYDIGEIGVPLPGRFDECSDMLSHFVDDVLKGYPVDPSKVFLLGFSMGTVMSFALSLTRPALFAGVVANSGYVPEGTRLTLRWQELSHLGFFIAHGTHDEIIPLSMARRARMLFEASNARLTYREYAMGHEISEESLADASAWLSGLIHA